MANPLVSVGVLSGKNSYGGASIRKAVRDLGHRAVHLTWDKLTFETRNNDVHLPADIDVLVNWGGTRQHIQMVERLGAVAAFEQVVPTVNNTNAILLSNHKAASLCTLANADGVRVPDSVYSISHKTLNEEADRRGDQVLKPVLGGGGSEVQKVSEDSETIGLLSGPQTGILQSYIDTGEDIHNDVRAFVVNDVVVAAMKRSAPEDDDDQWITNISSGGDPEKLDLDPDAEDMAVAAMDAHELDVGGVDLIQDADGEWYVLEINAPAGFSGLHRATGVNVAPFIAVHAIDQVCDDPGFASEDAARLSLETGITSPDTTTREARSYSLDPSRDYWFAGRNRATHVSLEIDRSNEGWAIDKSVAENIGAGPLKTFTECPIGDHDHEVPKLRVAIELGGEVYLFSTPVCDLSDYDADFVISYPVINDAVLEKFKNGGEPVESVFGDEHTSTPE